MYIFSWCFLFSVNAYVYIPMMLFFMVQNCYTFSKMDILGEIVFFFAWDFKGLSWSDIRDFYDSKFLIIFQNVIFSDFYDSKFLVIFQNAIFCDF